MRRVSFYIDGGPLLDGIRGQGFSVDLDWMAFLRSSTNNAEISRVHFFISELPEQPYPVKHQNQIALLKTLHDQGIEIHLGRTQVVSSIFVDRGIEAAMATRLLTDAHSDAFDTFVVVSKRQDLSLPLAALQEMGKKVEVAFFQYERDPFNPLHRHCDRTHTITCASVARHVRSGPVPYFSQEMATYEAA
ncbi:NYN domain-containing protein [Caballeronia sp. GAWG2-1]|uniref:NYN domain-containing protein n=1 Tax=Caballeronia sp. GAWG2-1 TaxID=2921744 RepID=UPI002027A2BB|nr:NYN domain-containing protein [Caballeronia sp. GAWG2-1]